MASMSTYATISDVATYKWKLPEYLEQHEITPYRLGVELGGHKRIPVIYRLAKKDKPPTRVDFDTLGELIKGLRVLTGKNVQLSDLLEYQDDEAN